MNAEIVGHKELAKQHLKEVAALANDYPGVKVVSTDQMAGIGNNWAEVAEVMHYEGAQLDECMKQAALATQQGLIETKIMHRLWGNNPTPMAELFEKIQHNAISLGGNMIGYHDSSDNKAPSLEQAKFIAQFRQAVTQATGGEVQDFQYYINCSFVFK